MSMNLAMSIAFYSKLFDAAPTRVESGVLKRRIDLLLSLPLDKLDTMSLQREVQGIAKR